ncbi:DNA ligase (ATP) [Blyttiomyces sp. JEL0837]|nr:DNA ligase (ATP) [Blyttiomyces sp. JEL0837]
MKAEEYPFAKLSLLLEGIQHDKDYKKKRKRLEKFISDLRESGDDFFPFLRLLVPNLDRDRAAYGIKDKVLANIYIELLSITRDSRDADVLINWRKPQSHGVAGDFAEVLYSVLKDRLARRADSGLSVADVNRQLDALNACENTAARRRVFEELVRNCTALENKWLARIVLKEMKMGVTENSVFNIWHPSALDLWNISSSLSRVAHELKDLSVNIHSNELALNSPFKPMLSKSMTNTSAIRKVMKRTFWIQTKLDGERMQLHKDGDSYKFFSRNGKDYTDLYGSSPDEKLTKYIHPNIRGEIKSCILDGEMMSYSVETGRFEEFGALKKAAQRLNEEGEAAISRPCFIVFDVLYANGKSMLESTLMDRYAVLKKIITPKPTYLEILDYQEGTTEADIIEALDQRMMDLEEGIIIKSPVSQYQLNDRGGDWMKLKPDYIASLGDDIDLLLVGAFFGSGRRSGKLSHFMCAILDDSSTADPPRYLTFCKIGSGYKWDEIEEITQESKGHWIPFNPKKLPPWLDHPSNSKERPDMILAPEHSRVICVKAAEIVKSEQYAATWTLRFPRFVRLRPDKSVLDVMTRKGLEEYLVANRGKMQSRMNEIDLHGKKQGKGSVWRKAAAVTVPTEYKGAKTQSVARVDELFAGLKFCVIAGAVRSQEGLCRKHEMETEIHIHGGTYVQNPGQDPSILLVADKIIAKVRNYFENYDIVKTDWIRDSILAKQRISLRPKYLLHAKESTRQEFKRSSDKYGDSFTEPLDLETAKELVSQMKTRQIPPLNIGSITTSSNPRSEELNFVRLVEERCSSFTVGPTRIFRGVVAYFDKDELIYVHEDMSLPNSASSSMTLVRAAPAKESRGYNSLEMLEPEVRFRGGHLSTMLGPWTTHIIINTPDDISEQFLGATAISGPILLSQVSGQANVAVSDVSIKMGRVGYYYDYHQPLSELGIVNFKGEADLSSLFTWNTKQLFVYVVVEYSTKTHKTNQIVIWDDIITKKDDAVINFKKQKPEYNAADITNKIRHAFVEYDFVPHRD